MGTDYTDTLYTLQYLGAKFMVMGEILEVIKSPLDQNFRKGKRLDMLVQVRSRSRAPSLFPLPNMKKSGGAPGPGSNLNRHVWWCIQPTTRIFAAQTFLFLKLG